MKGNRFNMMRKLWLMALVLTLALSLTSCAKRKAYNLSAAYGYAQCDGNDWSFDVYVFRSQSQAGAYDLVIMPVTINQQGDIASVTIGNSQLGYKQLINQVVLNDGQEINAGVLSSADLNNYPILAITAFDATTNFVSSSPAKASYCYLPAPGDGVSQNQLQYYQP